MKTMITRQLLAPNLWLALNVRRCCVVSWRVLVSPQMSGERGSVTPVNDPQWPPVSCPGTTQWASLRVTEELKWSLLKISTAGSLSC